jgi:hypothetical protein
MNIYSESFVRGRIYSYLNFKKYLLKISKIVCEEMGYDDEILDVKIISDNKTVWVTFKDSDFGYDSALLWDQDIRETVKKYLEV